MQLMTFLTQWKKLQRMFEMYSIEYTDEYMAEFVENIQKAVAEMKLVSWFIS